MCVSVTFSNQRFVAIVHDAIIFGSVDVTEARLTAAQFSSEGFSDCLDNLPTANARSGREPIMRYVKLPIACL